jgi:hypothetical protein
VGDKRDLAQPNDDHQSLHGWRFLAWSVGWSSSSSIIIGPGIYPSTPVGHQAGSGQSSLRLRLSVDGQLEQNVPIVPRAGVTLTSDYLLVPCYFVGGAVLSPPWAFQIKFFESVARSQIRSFSTAPSEYAIPLK